MPANPTPIAARQVGQAPARPVNLVVIHCSATASGKPLQQGTPGKPGYLNAPQVINAWHAARGFHRQTAAMRAAGSLLPSIGYHYVIDLDGQVWAGRSLDEVGAHVQGYNSNSLGICMVGGVEREACYTAEQWASLRRLVRMLTLNYNIPLAAPKRLSPSAVSAGVCGHRDLSPDLNNNGVAEPTEWLKTCPGFDVRAWLARDMEPLPAQVYEVTA